MENVAEYLSNRLSIFCFTLLSNFLEEAVSDPLENKVFQVYMDEMAWDDVNMCL